MSLYKGDITILEIDAIVNAGEFADFNQLQSDSFRIFSWHAVHKWCPVNFVLFLFFFAQAEHSAWCAIHFAFVGLA